MQNIGHLNTNSLHNKFDTLKLLVKNSLDIDISIYRNNISINRSRFSLDHSLEGQFLMDGFTPPWRMNRNAKGGGMLKKIYPEAATRGVLCMSVENCEFVHIY